jgi:hypothetical protein
LASEHGHKLASQHALWVTSPLPLTPTHTGLALAPFCPPHSMLGLGWALAPRSRGRSRALFIAPGTISAIHRPQPSPHSLGWVTARPEPGHLLWPPSLSLKSQVASAKHSSTEILILPPLLDTKSTLNPIPQTRSPGQAAA